MQAKIRSLVVRPIQSADLSFNTAGVIDRIHPTNSLLGASISAYSALTDLYPNLGKKDPADEAKLVFDPERIEQQLGPHFLFAIRNQSLKTELLQILRQRENAFLEKYKHKAELIKKYQKLYPPTSDEVPSWEDVTASKPSSTLGRLDALKKATGANFSVVGAAMEPDDKKVAKNLKNVSKPSGSYETSVTAKAIPIYSASPTSVTQSDTNLTNQDDAIFQKIKHGDVTYTNAELEWKTTEQEFQVSKITFANGDHETLTKLDLGSYLHRPTENVSRHLRQQLDLDEEEFRQFIVSLGAGELDRILENELAILDLQVQKLQLNFAHTFLTSPVNGRVTAVYKDIGENVSVGEAVLRIENDSRLYLVGTLNFRGALRVTEPGDQGPVTIKISQLFETGTSVTIRNVRIAAVRGHDRDDDEWEVILECDNPVQSGKKVLPLNYQFDRDTTEIDIS